MFVRVVVEVLSDSVAVDLQKGLEGLAELDLVVVANVEGLVLAVVVQLQGLVVLSVPDDECVLRAPSLVDVDLPVHLVALSVQFF